MIRIDGIRICERCGNLDTVSPCAICNDPKRDDHEHMQQVRSDHVWLSDDGPDDRVEQRPAQRADDDQRDVCAREVTSRGDARKVRRVAEWLFRDLNLFLACRGSYWRRCERHRFHLRSYRNK